MRSWLGHFDNYWRIVLLKIIERNVSTNKFTPTINNELSLRLMNVEFEIDEFNIINEFVIERQNFWFA